VFDGGLGYDVAIVIHRRFVMRKPLLAALLTFSIGAVPLAGSAAVLGYRASAAGILDNVLVAMNDAPGTGEKIVQWLRDQNGVVKFMNGIPGSAVHLTLIDMGTGEKSPAVYIDSKFSKDPVSYRYLATLIARETSEMMLADFPMSAERAYMISAQTAEAYFELGGERAPLPRIDGIIDAQAADSMRLWIENAPDQGVKLLKSQGYSTLADLDAELETRKEAFQQEMRKKITALETAEEGEIAQLHRDLAVLSYKLQVAEATQAYVKQGQTKFAEFKQYEKEWLLSHTVK